MGERETERMRGCSEGGGARKKLDFILISVKIPAAHQILFLKGDL